MQTTHQSSTDLPRPSTNQIARTGKREIQQDPKIPNIGMEF